MDRKYLTASELQLGTSNPVRARRSFGGVARNVAENLARLGMHAALASVVGDDENGVAILEHAERCGIDTRLVLRESKFATPEYAAIVSAGGQLIVGLSDMTAVESISIADVEPMWARMQSGDWLFLDCNAGADVLSWCIGKARDTGAHLALDAVSEPKVCKLPDDLEGVEVLVLNEKEAAVYLYEDSGVFAARSYADRAGALISRGAKNVVLTMGERGAIASDGSRAEHIEAVPAQAIDTTGAGDALCAAVLFSLISGDDLFGGVRLGTLAAALTVESAATVRPDLSISLLDLHRGRLERAWTAH
jgi:pseudouridine kinase